jgi:multidrug efflux pump subunit AcrB
VKKTIPSSLYYILCLCVLVLSAVFLILIPQGDQGRQLYPVALVRAHLNAVVHPQVVEAELTQPLEKAISHISPGIQLESFSTEKEAVIQVFSGEENPDILWQVRDAVNAARKNLPADMDSPVITKPVDGKRPMFYTVESRVLSGVELTQFHEEEILPQIDRLAEVAYTQTLGGKQKVLRICPDYDKLERAGLTTMDLCHTLESENYAAGRSYLHLSRESVSPEELAEKAIDAGGNAAYRIKDFCSIESTEEPLNGFSGRKKESDKITGMVYYNDRFPAEVCRQKISEALKQLRLPAGKGVSVSPFDPGQETTAGIYPSWRLALVICSICFALITLLTFVAEIKKKVLMVTGAFILSAGMVLILYSLERPKKMDTVHFSVFIPPGDEMARQQLATRLAFEIQKEKGIEDLLWYGDYGHNAQPFDACLVHFYFRAGEQADRENLLRKLYTEISRIPGMALTQFPRDPRGFPIQGQLRIEGTDLEQLYRTTKNISEILQHNTDVDHVFSEATMIRPVRQYEVDLTNKGIARKALEDIRFDLGDDEVVINCGDGPENHSKEIFYRDMNEGGLLRRISLPVRLEAWPVAIQKHNGKYYTHVRFMTGHEQTIDRIQEQLQTLPLSRDELISWEEE